MIVDCGGGTVDLTTRKLLDDNKLGEVTERAGDYCGSAFVDAEFIEYLRKELGSNAIDSFRDNYYGQMQYMVQEFCQHVKLPFTGDSTFNYEMNLEEVSPTLVQYLSDEVNLTSESDEVKLNIQKIKDADWLIKLDFEKIKSMFDPVIERISRMIRIQLKNRERGKGEGESESDKKCSVMFLVGGFSQSEYLQKKIREEFGTEVDNISVPTNPIAAISRGAAIYGLSFGNLDDDMINMDLPFVINSRILNRTYGIKVLKDDNPDYFHIIAKRGKEVNINEEFPVRLRPSFHSQTSGVFEIYYTREFKASSCKDPGMILLGELKIDWPDTELGLNRPTTFKLAFGKMEVRATAKNETNGQNYQTTFEVDTRDE
jgi:molecular chaperone DnaK (HSP70)